MNSDQQIEQGLVELGLSLNEWQCEQLRGYLALLSKWNKAYNLTAIRRPEQMVGLHLMDSLAVLPFVSGDRVLDVGAGAGLPGLVLAIARPDLQITVLDSNGKKTRFMTQAKIELGLSQVRVEHQRIEQHTLEAGYTTVVSRAFTALPRFVSLCERFVADAGVLLAMLGQADGLSLQQRYASSQITHLSQLQVPGVDTSARHVAILQRSASPLGAQ